MATIPVSTTATLLVAWANGQDAWIRTLVKTILDTNAPLASDELDALYEQFLREKQLLPGQSMDVPMLATPSPETIAGAPLSINSIADIQRVNALSAGQTITFNPRLTIVFGENASGKSGYVRVIKRASNARTKEPILPNLYAHQQGEPTATIAYTQDGQSRSITWRNEEGLRPLNRIDVFDVRAAGVHVDVDLAYTYTPGELNRFPYLQQGITTVKERLQSDATARTATRNPFVQHFDRRAKLYPRIENLGASTNIADLEGHATLSEEETQRISSLQMEIEALKSNTPQAQLRLALNHQQHLKTINDAVTAVSALDHSNFSSVQQLWEQASVRYEQASKEAFAGLAIPGILQPAWRAFIEAGETYIAATNQDPYPGEEPHCLYCQQTLSPVAVDLLRKYRDYCNSEFRADLDKAQRELAAMAAPITTLKMADLQNALTGIAENSTPTLRQKTLAFVDELAVIHPGISTNATVAPKRLVELAAVVGPELDAAAQESAALVTTLKERAEERTASLKTREEDLLDLQTRSTLQRLLPELREYVEHAQWVNKANIQLQRIPNVLRSLTETAKTASEDVLNKNFEQRFQAECAKLRAPRVTLDFPGRQGQAIRRKTVASTHHLSTVLSEGEQKVIALADFLAEIAMKPPAPVVFDDPVTSLDYRRLQDLVARLVELSEERQVILFTHNIWFTTELLSHFERNPADCAYYDLTRSDQGTGIVTKGTHPRADTYSSLKGKLNSLIQSAQPLTGEARAAVVEKGYEYLRSICEVVVETELLQKVVQRYQPNVMMTSLKNIKVDRLQPAIASITPVFEDCCRFIASHSQPLETLNVRPTLEDLTTAWVTVQTARNTYIKT